jgi:hypothetical protein
MSFDPVSEPDAYRRSLLTALGDEDPAVVLAAGPAAARQLAQTAGSLLRIRPEQDEWSVMECLAHLADSELVTGARLRWIASEEQPDIVGYDQALWVAAMHQLDEDLDTLLGAFEANRRWNLALWERLPVAARSRFGIHRERGEESIDLIVRLAAGHDIVHLEQARRTLDLARDAPLG